MKLLLECNNHTCCSSFISIFFLICIAILGDIGWFYDEDTTHQPSTKNHTISHLSHEPFSAFLRNLLLPAKFYSGAKLRALEAFSPQTCRFLNFTNLKHIKSTFWVPYTVPFASFPLSGFADIRQRLIYCRRKSFQE